MFLEQEGAPTLTILDFALQLLAVFYGVFATAVDFKDEVDGKKRLSKAGKLGLVFLFLISIGGVIVKARLNQAADRSKAEERRRQQQAETELDLNLKNSQAMLVGLRDQDRNLRDQMQSLSKQRQLLADQTRTLSTVAQSGTRTLEATERLLDPLDSDLEMRVGEDIAVDSSTMQGWRSKIHILGNHGGSLFDVDSSSREWADAGFQKLTTQVLIIKIYRGGEKAGGLLMEFDGYCPNPRSGDNYFSHVTSIANEVTFLCGYKGKVTNVSPDVSSYRDLQGSQAVVMLGAGDGGGPLSTRLPVKSIEIDLLGHLRSIRIQHLTEQPCEARLAFLKTPCFGGLIAIEKRY